MFIVYIPQAVVCIYAGLKYQYTEPEIQVRITDKHFGFVATYAEGEV